MLLKSSLLHYLQFCGVVLIHKKKCKMTWKNSMMQPLHCGVPCFIPRSLSSPKQFRKLMLLEKYVLE